MNVLTRGMRNAFRNTLRTVSIVIILGLSIGLALAMLVARASVQDKITEVKRSIGTTITLMPAGVQGFQGGGEPLATEQLAKVEDLANVTKLAQTLNDRLTTENSSLTSAIDAGSLGQRGVGNSGITFRIAEPGGTAMGAEGSSGEVVRTFTPPVVVTGTNDLSSASVFGGDAVTLISGKAFDPSKDEDVALIGKELAQKNALQVGSTFTAYGKTITVVGIYDAGTLFANNGVFFQLAALQRLSGQSTSVTNATATVNSVDNMEAAIAAVKNVLGDSADVTSNLDAAQQAIKPLESVKTIALFSLIGALAAGAVIILLTMVMIVRERRREIGVFKAIGASNAKVLLQFMSEAVTLTVLAMAAGVIIGAAAASPLTAMLVTNSTSNAATAEDQTEGLPPFASTEPVVMQAGPGGARGFSAQFRDLGANTMENAKNVKASVGLDILAYGVGAAFVIAIVGSALPAFFIAKIRPAEVMRAE